MAIELLAKQEKQNIFAVVFVFFLFATFLVLFVGFFRQKGVTFVPPVIPPPAQKIEINFQALDSQVLKELMLMEDITLPEEKGRENPFLPY